MNDKTILCCQLVTGASENLLFSLSNTGDTSRRNTLRDALFGYKNTECRFDGGDCVWENVTMW
jgi:hypothetical protein